MRLKLDESLPEDARALAIELGHDADSVRSEGLSGRDDVTVLEAVRREGRFLITLDRGFGDIRRYPPGTHPGIAVVRAGSQDAPTLMASVRRLLAREVIEDLRGSQTVVNGGHEGSFTDSVFAAQTGCSLTRARSPNRQHQNYDI